MLKREGWTDTFVTDVPFSRVAEFQSAVAHHDRDALYGIGRDAGILAMFGNPSRFEGRDVTGYRLNSAGLMPNDYVPTGHGVDWDHTEKINEVPLTEVDPRTVKEVIQPTVTEAGVRHYLEDTTGALYDTRHQVSNQFPAIFEDLDTGNRRMLTGHHRGVAALVKGEPIMARLVRGRLQRRR